MAITEFEVFSVISTFTDLGMDVFHVPDMPNMTYHDFLNIANYYSVILNIGESSGGLYGPLPVAYRTDSLLFLYTFEMKNHSVVDERAIRNNHVVPSFLLIFFPTAVETLATRAREKISKEISRWKINFSSIDDVSASDIRKLNSSISTMIMKEQSNFEMSEIEEANVVIGKSIELLHNVTKYQEKPVRLLIVGSEDCIDNMARTAIFEKNSSIVTYFKAENGILDATLKNIILKIIKTKDDNSSLHKYISHDLNGVLYFGNFSSHERGEKETRELEKIIKNTNQDCAITFAISQTSKPIEIQNTSIPLVLQEGLGRSISLIDLARPNMTISLSLIDFLEKVIEHMKKV